MRKIMLKLVFVMSVASFYAAYLLDGYKVPSDSGNMTWFTYLMLNHKANQGDGAALSQLIHHYEMDDARLHANKIAELLMSCVMSGYGGVRQGGEGVTMSFIENCANLGAEGSERTANLFTIVRERGGGLTEYGQDVETRWLSGEFPGCAPFVVKPKDEKT